MTTIAFDGHTLAADKRSCNGSAISVVTKIIRLRGCLVGTAGPSGDGREMRAWFEAGAEPSKMPAFQRTKDQFIEMMVIERDGSILKFDGSPIPFKIESPFYAIGSGREFALAAMHLGKTAREAIEVASALDCYTGNGIDILELESKE